MKVDIPISSLLNAAQRKAIDEIGEVPATPNNLERLAATVRENILKQVDIGSWMAWEITDRDQLAFLGVSARLGKGLTEAPIVVEYDFTRTPLIRLQTVAGMVPV